MSGVGGFQYPNENIPEFPNYLLQGSRGNSASMKAAANPDINILKAVLARRKPFNTPESEENVLYDNCGPNSKVGWPGQDFINTPLLQAIQSQLPQNVELLLKLGAYPNGVDLRSLENHQAFFLRFRPRIPDYPDIDGDVADRKTLLACMELPQTADITIEEIEDRVHHTTPFWVVHDEYCPEIEDMHSVIAAARQPSTQILDMLLKADADISVWTSNSSRDNGPLHSSLAMTSPLHVAISDGNIAMISYLLSLGFDPDFVPLSTPTACLTPLMSTFLIAFKQQMPPLTLELPTTFNLPAYSALITHPKLELTLTTPILSIHLFHMAVAHGSHSLFKHILSTFPISPACVAPTKLGQTLLHIACLPISTENLTNSLAVIQSVHDTRSIYPRLRHRTQSNSDFATAAIQNFAELPKPKSKVNQPEQTALIGFLVSTLPQNATEQDIYGNAALHYLASHAFPNLDSISILRSAEGGEDVWNNVRNRWGYSAKDLFESVFSEDEVREWRDLERKEVNAERWRRNEWWDMRLARDQEELEIYVPNTGLLVKKRRSTRERGRGRGRGRGDRGRNSPEPYNEFPYHSLTEAEPLRTLGQRRNTSAGK